MYRGLLVIATRMGLSHSETHRRHSRDMDTFLATGLCLALLPGITLAVLCLGSTSSASETEIAERMSICKEIFETHFANLGKIRTWRGRAKVTESWEYPKGYPDDIGLVEQDVHATVSFVYDSPSGNVRTHFRYLKNANALESGTVESYLLPDRHQMIKNGKHYWFNEFPPDREGTMKKEGESKTSYGAQMHRTLNIDPTPPRGLSSELEYFHPMERIFPIQPTIVSDLFQTRYDKYEKTPTEPDEGFGVTREGTCYKIRDVLTDTAYDLYWVEMAKGALIVRKRSIRDGEIIGELTTDPQRIANIWIPRKTTLWSRGSVGRIKDGLVHRREVLWEENHINEPLATDEFSIVKLHVCKGDWVSDRCSGERYRIAGESFPPRPLPSPDTVAAIARGQAGRSNHQWQPWRVTVITIGAVLFLGAIASRVFLMRWQRTETNAEDA